MQLSVIKKHNLEQESVLGIEGAWSTITSLWEYLEALLLVGAFTSVSENKLCVFCRWKGFGQGVRPINAAVVTPGDPRPRQLCVPWHNSMQKQKLWAMAFPPRAEGYQTCSSDVSRGFLQACLRTNRIFSGRAL